MVSSPTSTPAQGAGVPERIGHFKIHGILGRGAMGVVFDAETPGGQRVALKIIQPAGDADSSATLVARFLREAKILEQLDHPGVVDLVEAGDMDGVLYLAMERIEGVSLLAIRRRGPITLEPLMQLGVQLADALAHLHAAGVVHRDIKPANILIQSDGRPVITDFGISGLSEATGITRQGDLLGSPGFMAPEVIAGGGPTVLSDQYALGRLMFELGARGPSQRLPKNAPIFEVLRIAMEVDWSRFPTEAGWAGVRGVVQRMLAPHPEDRFGAASEVRTALEGLSSSVLDSETLSEHVEQLALPTSTSYEALALDLLAGDSPADHTDQEAFLEDLELPAGLRADRRPSEPPPAPLDDSAFVPLPGGTSELLLGSPDPDELDATRIDAAAPDAAAPDTVPPGPAALTLPTGPGPVETAEAVPLSDLLRPRDPRGRSPTELGPEQTRIDHLERQAVRAREDLAQLRRSLAEAKARKPWAWVLLCVGLAAGGWALGRGLNPAPPPQVELVLVPTDATHPSAPRYEYTKAAPPSPADRQDGLSLLIQAQTHFAARDLDQAERLLSLCIQLADLPECHRALGSMLTLTRSPEARAHLLRYLELAPQAPDAAAIRAALTP